MPSSNQVAAAGSLVFQKLTAEYFRSTHQNLHLVHLGCLESTQPFQMLLCLHVCICVAGLLLCCWVGRGGVFHLSCWTFGKGSSPSEAGAQNIPVFAGAEHRRARCLRSKARLFLCVGRRKPSNIKQHAYASVQSPPAQSVWAAHQTKQENTYI